MQAFIGALLAASLAIAAPALQPFSPLPVSTLLTDTVALAGWGVWIAFIGARTVACGRVSVAERGLQALLWLAALLALAALAGVVFAGGPSRIAARQLAMLFVAAAALLAGARMMHRAPDGGLQHRDLIRALLWALLLAGAANAVIAALQYLAPGSTYVEIGADGRTGGNLRQPNHLATQALWALLALVALRETGRFPGWLFAALGALLIVALAMSASRTGALACLLPALWGLCDRRLSRSTRAALMAAPLLLLLCWGAVTAWPPDVVARPDGSTLLNRADLNTTRWALWQQSLRLIGQNPWLGVGMGQFGFAWTLTPMAPLPRSPFETFSHAHNLLLHWAVELGLPLAVALTALLLWALWRALRLARRAEGAEGTVRSAALAMLAVVLLHSQLEYPLWHANFLLPTACLFGLALGGGAKPAPRRWVSKAPPTLAGGLIALAAVAAFHDYQAVAHIHSPLEDGLSDAQRIARGRESVLFGHFADRYAGTLAPRGERALAPYREVVFEHIDVQLLRSWAIAHAETGHLDKARYLAARVKEFDRPMTRPFFEVCATPQGEAAFQCSPPPPGMSFSDFR